MSKIKRAVAITLIILMLVSVSGCMSMAGVGYIISQLIGNEENEAVPTTPPDAEINPAQTPSGTTPATEQSSEESERLNALDMEIFARTATSDALTYHLTIAHPENFPELGEVPSGWGELSYENDVEATREEVEWLEELNSIDRDSLTDDERITLDTLKTYLERGIESMDYYYYPEVLDTFVGIHSNLPLNMVFYDIKTAEDARGYLELLEDSPRYIEAILSYEQKKSEEGLFMRDTALDTVLEQIKTFVDSGDTCFLYTTYDASIDAVEELTDEERAELSKKNDELVTALLASYNTLYDGLEKLRGTGANENGLSAYGEEGRSYFEYGLKEAACADITPDEALDILNDEILAQMNIMMNAVMEEPDVFDKFDTISLSIGTTEENLAYLEELMKESYPELPTHTLTLMACPEELEGQFSPAAYLIPPVDDASENLIILNEATLDEDTRYLDTLAHEGYPGHMYHYQYLRTLTDKTGLTRQTMALSGYYEAWSQTAESFFDANNTKFSNAYCELMTTNTMLGNLLLPAISSIRVNYFGDDEAALAEVIEQYYDEETAKELAGFYYQYAVENPFYFLEYALGYSMLQQKLRSAEETLGDSFSLIEFNRAYLEIGPAYFDTILDEMDKWIAGN